MTDYAPRSTAGRAYEALWQEIRARVGGLRLLPTAFNSAVLSVDVRHRRAAR